jgi:drug/metabolite transporter (DMT)-like permease
MDATIAALVLASAALHPIRDLIVKKIHFRESAYIGITASWILISAIHATLTQGNVYLPFSLLPMIVFSSFGLVLYYVGITVSLRQGELSVYYPIIRSSPLFIVAVNFLVFGHSYAAITLTGIVLAVAGAFFIQYQRGAGLFDKPYLFTVAAIAMAGHGITTLADAKAMRLVEPAAFLFWTYLLTLFTQLAWFQCTKPEGRLSLQHIAGAWGSNPVRVLLAGSLSYLSYVFIMTAFQLGGEAAAVTAVRQASIPISVLLGVFILREGNLGSRLSWSMVLAGGIAIIVFVK